MYRCILDPKKLKNSVGLINVMLAHNENCPAVEITRCPGSGRQNKNDPCAKTGSTSKFGPGSGSGTGPGLKRALRSGPCRFGFIPDEWFTFFYSQTGVSGPYVFGFVLGNYLVSKEIYIMEHEYYSGLSVALVCYLATTRLGPSIGKSLDDEVDAIAAGYQKVRDDEIAVYENSKQEAKKAQEMAKGQELLMAAKKENIKMQLEAAYRERMMQVYSTVRGRMDYHVKRHRVESRIHQKWMIQWILDRVMQSITPEFEKQALDSAIRDLAAVAGRNA